MNSRIREELDRCRLAHRKALIPFITGGYPSIEFTRSVIDVMASSGADVIEIGVPFSDPLADGPTIQMANTEAISKGVNPRMIMDCVSQARSDGCHTPIALLVYINSIYRYGVKGFLYDCIKSGVDGLVIPDLPVEERSLFFESISQESSLVSRMPALIPLVAPTTRWERIDDILDSTSGFVYCISTTGVTGVRESLPKSTQSMIDRVRAKTQMPIALGFGIGDPQTAKDASEIVDAVIVGSALIEGIRAAVTDEVSDDTDRELAALDSVKSLITTMKHAINPMCVDL